MSGVAKRSVQLFYDVLSPYSWLGFELMCRYQQKWTTMQLELKPFLLGAVMAASENQPPGINPTRAAYLTRDLHRLREYCQVPLNSPSDFMGTVIVKGSMKAQRLLTVVNMTSPQYTEDLSRVLWTRIWSKDEDITEPSSLLQACVDAGLTVAESEGFLSRIKDQDVKEKLKSVTQEAIDAGAFGAPTILVEAADGKKKLVFGSDRMHIIATMLGEKYDGPLLELAKTKL